MAFNGIKLTPRKVVKTVILKYVFFKHPHQTIFSLYIKIIEDKLMYYQNIFFSEISQTIYKILVLKVVIHNKQPFTNNAFVYIFKKATEKTF